MWFHSCKVKYICKQCGVELLNELSTLINDLKQQNFRLQCEQLSYGVYKTIFFCQRQICVFEKNIGSWDRRLNMTSTPNGTPYDDPASKPLFGEHRPKDRVLNLVVACITGILVAVTLVSAFVFPQGQPLNAINIFFAVVMLLVALSHLLLIYWYRQGDLDPKFLRMIFFNTFTMILLCVCGNLYIHNVKWNFSGVMSRMCVYLQFVIIYQYHRTHISSFHIKELSFLWNQTRRKEFFFARAVVHVLNVW